MSYIKSITRRSFIEGAARTGLIVPLATPLIVSGCKSEEKSDHGEGAPESKPASQPGSAPSSKPSVTGGLPAGVPLVKPTDWDAIAFNTARGKAGAIPESYIDDITGPDGVKKHLGKHLPYQPGSIPKDRMLESYLAIMWGDPSKGYTMHPNAPKSEKNPEGHWYDWIRVARTTDDSSEIETRFDNWPKPTDAVKGRIVGAKAKDPADNGGKNTVYLTQLPPGAKSGDVLRVWAHCLTHGEYIDFITLA